MSDKVGGVLRDLVRGLLGGLVRYFLRGFIKSLVRLSKRFRDLFSILSESKESSYCICQLTYRLNKRFCESHKMFALLVNCVSGSMMVDCVG